jgi:hypothetical protein
MGHKTLRAADPNVLSGMVAEYGWVALYIATFYVLISPEFINGCARRCPPVVPPCPAVTAFVRHSVTAASQGGVWPATGGGVVVWWCRV